MSEGTLSPPGTPESEFVDDKRVSAISGATLFDLKYQEQKLPTDPLPHPLAQLGAVRKNILLTIFAVAQFVDVCNVSGVAIAVAQISADIKLELSQIVWIITSYSLCFLLFAGRLSDLFPAQLVFEGGFLILGIFCTVVSFVTSNKYAFLILRGLSGLAGTLTIPSAYHLAVHMFPNPAEQQKKLALLSLSGAIGNILGLVVAGLCMLKRYTVFFQLLGAICIVFSALTIAFLPYTPSSYSKESNGPRYKRMDIVGVIILTGALICFILALTQGPIDGWGSPSFLVPMMISLVLGPAFFFWEAYIPAKSAVLPITIWSTTNIIITSIAILCPFSFWATSQLQYATYFQEVSHWKPIHVAAAILPQGVFGLIVGASAQAMPQILNKPRYAIAIGGLLIIVAQVLQVISNGGSGNDYWKYAFPAYVIGSAGAILSFLASAIGLITMCPPEMSGVASAWTQVVAQIGAAITLAVQAGLQGPSIADWKTGGARGYWFVIAFTAICSLQFLVFYKTPQAAEVEHENARELIRKSTKGGEVAPAVA